MYNVLVLYLFFSSIWERKNLMSQFSESVDPDKKVRCSFNKNNIIIVCSCKDFLWLILEQSFCQSQSLFTTQTFLAVAVLTQTHSPDSPQKTDLQLLRFSAVLHILIIICRLCHCNADSNLLTARFPRFWICVPFFKWVLSWPWW